MSGFEVQFLHAALVEFFSTNLLLYNIIFTLLFTNSFLYFSNIFKLTAQQFEQLLSLHFEEVLLLT